MTYAPNAHTISSIYVTERTTNRIREVNKHFSFTSHYVFLQYTVFSAPDRVTGAIITNNHGQIDVNIVGLLNRF